jgi:hypothetical protein
VRLFVGSLEGAILIARSYLEVSRLESAAQHLLEKLQPAGHGPRRPRARDRPARSRAAGQPRRSGTANQGQMYPVPLGFRKQPTDSGRNIFGKKRTTFGNSTANAIATKKTT